MPFCAPGLPAAAANPIHDRVPDTMTLRTLILYHPRGVFAAMSLVALLGLAACNQPSGPPPGPPSGPPSVSVAAAIEKQIVETDEFPGRIEAVDQVEVRARVTGYIQSVHFKSGAEVRKGDLLFLIDPRPFEAAVAQAQATLGNTRAQLDLARTVLARNQALLAERATSKREYDEAAASVRSLEAQLRANQAALDTARLNLSYTRVTAPVSGRVGKAEITPGNLIQGEVPNSPLLTTVVSSNPIYVSFEVDEGAFLKYIGSSRGGSLPIAVGLADEPGSRTSGASNSSTTASIRRPEPCVCARCSTTRPGDSRPGSSRGSSSATRRSRGSRCWSQTGPSARIRANVSCWSWTGKTTHSSVK